MFLLERLQFIKATIADFIRPFGVCQQSTTDTAFTLGIGVETVVDGPAMHLLRKVRDASHSVAIGSQRRRRRESRFREFIAKEELEEDDEVVSV